MRTWLFTLTLLPAVVSAADAVPDIIPLELLARLPAFREPRVSPDAANLAVHMTAGDRMDVIVQKLMTPDDQERGKATRLGSSDNFVEDYAWANNERLILTVRSTAAVRGNLWNIQRMYAVNRDGSEPIVFKMEPNDFGFYRQYPDVLSFLDEDPEHVLAMLDDEPDDWHEPRVHRVNIYSGKRKLVAKNRRGIFRWIADNDGQVRIGVRYRLNFGKTGVETFYRESNDADWETLQEIDYFDNDRLVPVRFDDDDPNILLVTGDGLVEGDEDADDFDLFRYDLTTRKVTGRHVNQDWKRLLDMVAGNLPDYTIEGVSRSDDFQVAFFRAYSDTKVPEYWMLDLRYKRLDYVATEYPELDDYQFAPMQALSFEARDGRTIPAFLTLPVGREPRGLPLIVMPHGGPWANDEWGFDNYVQLFANRGYAVVQPQFRGSTGFGIDHETAGYGEWGKAIQDDITDSARWLIDEGIVDPERVCIYGESFGGYAAALALQREPELFRCGVAVNGVMDLKRFIDAGSNLLFENINRKVWNERADADQNSPYYLAKEIQAPLLIVGSERDTVVPVQHSRRMHKRLKRLKRDVTYVELPDGEHWHTSNENELTKLKAVMAFFARHLPAS